MASIRAKNYGRELNDQDLTRCFQYQNFRRQHVDRVLKAQAHESIKSSRSLVPRRNSTDSNAKDASMKRSAGSMRPSEPILQNLHILQRGGLGSQSRSGFCQGGLTSTEVERKIEMQRENFDLMNKLAKVTQRKNQYVNCGSRSGKMLDRQTRHVRESRALEKANLGIYLNIVGQEPKVHKTDTLRMNEINRTRLVHLMGRRVANASRVKSLADSLLQQRYGTTGSSNRLFKQCKTCKYVKETSSRTPQMTKNFCRHSSFEEGLFQFAALTSPMNVEHSVNIELDPSHSAFSKNNLHSVRSIGGSIQKMPSSSRKKRPASAVVHGRGTAAYLESQRVLQSNTKAAPSTASRTTQQYSNQLTGSISGGQTGSFNGAIVPAFLTSVRQQRMLQSAAQAKVESIDALLKQDSTGSLAGQLLDGSLKMSVRELQPVATLDEEPYDIGKFSLEKDTIDVGERQIMNSDQPTLELADRPTYKNKGNVLREALATNITTKPDFPHAISTQVPSTSGSGGEVLLRNSLQKVGPISHASITSKQKKKRNSRSPRDSLAKPQSAMQKRPTTSHVWNSLDFQGTSNHYSSSKQGRRKMTVAARRNLNQQKDSHNSHTGASLSRASTAKTRSQTNLSKSKSNHTLQSKIGSRQGRPPKNAPRPMPNHQGSVSGLESSQIEQLTTSSASALNKPRKNQMVVVGGVSQATPQRKATAKSTIQEVGADEGSAEVNEAYSQALLTRPTTQTSHISIRNNFEHRQSRKAILKSTLEEIQREIGLH